MREITEVHTRLLRFTLGAEESRAWWSRPASVPSSQAFAEQWFGRKSEAAVRLVVGSLRLRFDDYPEALAVLRAWGDMSGPTRRLVCHWHVQLTDPLYRAFSGELLPTRRDVAREEIARWVEARVPGRWNASTREQWGVKLLATAREAGLLAPSLVVPDDALAYLLHLLRGTEFAGDLLENPYLASVGLVGAALDDRLRALPDIQFRRMGTLRDLEWKSPSLTAWAEAR